MTAGVWLLVYDIAAADRDRYVDWFHDIHIPDKLARPGYCWAAHYETSPNHNLPDLYRYIGIFGAESTKVFLDPSPAQLKLTQTESTRAMMALRRNPSSAILAHEWSFSLNDKRNPRHCAGDLDLWIDGPYLTLFLIDAPQHDEAVGSFCAQQMAPGFAKFESAEICHKLSNVTGVPRHMVMLETEKTALPFGELDCKDKASMLFDFSHTRNLADSIDLKWRCGKRIWPKLTPANLD